MKIVRNWMCLLAVFAMVGSLAACGTQQETASEGDSSVTSAVGNDDAEEDRLEEDTAVGDDAPINEDELVIRGQETAPVESAAEATEGESSAADTVSSTADSASSIVEQDPQAPVESVNSAVQSAVDSPAQNETPVQQTSSAAPTSSVQETDALQESATEAATEAENVVSGIINLDNGISYEGEGISVSGNVVTITGEGDYVISGNLPEGMIEINTKLKVKLKLNGVNISNSTGPAIQVTDAKRLTITLIEGTNNSLSGGSVAYDGAIFTNDTLEIKGAGALTVNGTVEHGISSDDDIVVKNGNIQVNAVKTGMMANDDITVSGGSLQVVGGTNGIKSKGTLNISGGTIWTTGGPKDTKSALYSVGSFTLTGGSVYAVGCGATLPEPTFSTQCSAAITFSPSLAAGSAVSVASNGVQLFEGSAPTAYNTVFVSTPDMYDGMPFTVSANGAELGGFTTAGLVTSVTANT